MPENQDQTPTASKKVVYITKTKVKRPKSLVRTVISVLSFVVLVLTILLITSVIWLGSAWLQTYRAFTQETIVAKITVSEVKYDDAGNPYLELWYMPVEGPSALQEWLNFGGDTPELPSSFVLPGDAFRVQTDFFKWSNAGTWLGIKPMFRITRIAGDYVDIDDYNSLSHEAHDLNTGSDETWKYLKNNAEEYTWFGTAYVSSAGQNATNAERHFELIVTEDSLVLRAVE